MPDESEKKEVMRWHELTRAGGELPPPEAAALEDKLGINPEDLDTRIILVGHYENRRFQSESAREARIEHIAWFIDNCPNYHWTAGTHLSIDPGIDRLRNYLDLKGRWITQLQLMGSDVTVLYNAAHFFLLPEKLFAERALLKAEKLQPGEPKWPHELARLYRLWGYSFENQAIANTERCIALTSKPEDKFSEKSILPKLAFDAGHQEQAFDLANEVLVLSLEHKDSLHYAHAINGAYTTLGLIALRQNRLDDAKDLLMESIRGPRTAKYLFSFDPDRQLVGELFQSGEQGTVLRYLDELESIWHKEQVRFWRQKIAAQESPWSYELPAKRRFAALSRLPRLVYESGHWAKAEAAAKEFLTLADDFKDNDRHYGFGLHTAYVVLGQLALKQGAVTTANDYLVKAGEVPRAERLEESGPDFGLAADLTQLGHVDQVLHFLQSCWPLWGKSKDRSLLRDWAQDVATGTMPDDWSVLFAPCPI